MGKVKEIGRLIWKWILFLLLPPIELIIAIELGKALYSMGSFLGLVIMIVLGVVSEVISIKKLKEETEELFNL